MTALDIAPVIQGVMLTDLEAADEVKCEQPHFTTTCTGEVRWSGPPRPCGCIGRVLSCEGAHAFIFDGTRTPMRCAVCYRTFPISEWRKGWFPV